MSFTNPNCLGIKKMDGLWKDMENIKLSDRGMIWNSDLVESLELQNCMINAQQVTRLIKYFIKYKIRKRYTATP